MTIEEWREIATEALNNPGDETSVQNAARLVREFSFDMAYGGPLAGLDSDGCPLEDDEVNEVCRVFGYAEVAGD